MPIQEDLEKLRSEAEEGNSRAGPSRHQALEEVDPFAPTTASGMVETERDKLIRLVRLHPSCEMLTTIGKLKGGGGGGCFLTKLPPNFGAQGGGWG